MKGVAEKIPAPASKKNQYPAKKGGDRNHNDAKPDNQESTATTTQSAAGGVKWVPDDNLHLTLKFLGEVENVEIHEICKVASEVCARFDPFELRFVGSGFLPDEVRARVLAVRVEDPTEALSTIVRELEDRFADLGFKRESRDYVPHLTLGRVRSGSRRFAPAIIQRWKQYEHDPLGEMTVDNVQVIGSFLEKRGPTYNVMNTVEL